MSNLGPSEHTAPFKWRSWWDFKLARCRWANKMISKCSSPSQGSAAAQKAVASLFIERPLLILDHFSSEVFNQSFFFFAILSFFCLFLYNLTSFNLRPRFIWSFRPIFSLLCSSVTLLLLSCLLYQEALVEAQAGSINAKEAAKFTILFCFRLRM